MNTVKTLVIRGSIEDRFLNRFFFHLVFIPWISCIFLLYGQSPNSNRNIAFENAMIYNGEGFSKKNLYSIHGTISFIRPKEIDTTYNLKGHFLIPPFGDAHTHNLDRDWQLRFLPKAYLDEGTFYVQNLTSKLDGTIKARPFFRSKNTPDVKFAHQGLTSTLGHPFMAYEPFTMGLDYKDWQDNLDSIRKSRLDQNNSYIFIDELEEVDKKLEMYFANKPDIAKIFLINSEDHKETFNNEVMADNGLSIEVAEAVIEQLKNQELTIYAHIESTYDFDNGIAMGVDYFAHMPGYNWNGSEDEKSKYYVSDTLIKKAVDKGVGVIPTIGQALRLKSKDSITKREFVKDFLKRFHHLGGNLIFGADAFNQTMKGEIELLIDLEIFDQRTILELLTVTTPKAIFPDRKIGKLEEGYECSFLVLKRDPLEEIRSILEVKFGVKQGVDLSLKN
ncbi:MAG: hypothetical protein AAF039_05890 [Bacteroidota bacterium]